ncbi:MAG: hypothetical protein MI744_06615, partial [Pseudomonadales bacterium]|nr:hypothetical protein [Pseudomonadales bacterium]
IDPDGVLIWSGDQKKLNTELQKIYRKYKKQMIRDNSKLSVDEQTVKKAKEKLSIAQALLSEKKFDAVIQTLAKIPTNAALDDSVLNSIKQLLAKFKSLVLTDAEARQAIMSNRKLVDQILKLGKRTEQTFEKNETIEKKKAEEQKNESVNVKILRSKFETASRYAQRNKYFAAYELYEWIVDHASESPIGHQMKEIQSRDQFMDNYFIYLQKKRADQLLKAAKSMESAGEIQAAMNNYRIIMVECPQAKEAYDTAKAKLTELSK